MISLLNNKNNEIILYGAGTLGIDFIAFCKIKGVKIKYILDKKFQTQENFMGIPAYTPLEYYPSEQEKKEGIVIITVFRKELQKEIKQFLQEKGFKNIFWCFDIIEYQNYLNKFLYPDWKKKKFFQKLINCNEYNKDIAVILHLYYFDLLPEIKFYLSHITDPFDLYISINQKVNAKEVKEEFLKEFPYINAEIYIYENRGRDIAPFLKIFKKIYKKNYKKILKIHTKKSLHIPYGNLWRRQLYSRLIGDVKCYKTVKKIFQTFPEVGIIAPLGYLYPLKYYIGKNKEKLKKLANIFKISFDEQENFFFIAGTMFWFKPRVFKRLASIDLDLLNFEPETGQIDGTLAHAFERFFGILPKIEGYKILQMSEEGKIYTF